VKKNKARKQTWETYTDNRFPIQYICIKHLLAKNRGYMRRCEPMTLSLI
jgi:hypothetical protein